MKIAFVLPYIKLVVAAFGFGAGFGVRHLLTKYHVRITPAEVKAAQAAAKAVEAAVPAAVPVVQEVEHIGGAVTG